MTRCPLSDFANTVNEILPVIFKEFTRRQANELYKGKITLPQFVILNFLNKQTECKMTDLARFMGVTTAAITGITDRLAGYGYATRNHDTKDRRVIKIKLTLKGAVLVKKINQQRQQMIINVFGKISEADRSDYLRILTRIHEVLSEEKGEQPQ